jgi:hypothetical protein
VFLEKSNDVVAISKLFQSKFCADNFFSIFFFLNNWIDFEGSLEYGKWYMEEVYVNFMLRVKLYMWWEKNGYLGYNVTIVCIKYLLFL